MKKLIVLVLVFALTFSGTVYAEDLNVRIEELEALVESLEMQIVEKDNRIAELEAQLAGSDVEVSNQESYTFGETWVVEDQWKLTLLDVEEIAERNEYADTDPAAVYVITYEYENLGYVDTDGIMNGLFLSLDMGNIVDADGSMGYMYPGDITYYAQETPVGAKCKAQVCIGVDNAGDFKIHFYAYDGNYNGYSTVFDITVE